MKNNYHVYFRSKGTVTVTVFDSNDTITEYPNEEALPMWIREKVALLRMVKVGESVDGVGTQVWRDGFYLDPPKENEV